jgi:hypothetical protein
VLLTGFLGVQDFDVEDVDGIDGSPWNPNRVRERTFMVRMFQFTYVTYD